MKKRMYACLLSIIVAFGVVATACGETEKPKNPVKEKTEHLVTEGRLHNVTIRETSKPFIVDGETEYRILVADSDLAKKAANFFKEHMHAATGANFAVETETLLSRAWTDDEKYIVIGSDKWFSQAGLSMPNADFGFSGYYIKTIGNTVFVKTAHEYGYQHAALKLLDALVGYEMYAADAIVYHTPKTTMNLPDFDVTERPDVDLHASGNNLVDKDAMYGMGFLDRGEIFISIQGKKEKVSVHNCMEILEYAEDKQGVTINPAWISTAGSYSSKNGGGVSQICYTGGASDTGSLSEGERERLAEETLSSLVDVVSDVMIENLELEENKNKTVITFTQEDNRSTACGCWKCEEEREKYNGASSASVVKFVNRVNRKVQAYLQEKAERENAQKRNVDLLFFAYQWTEVAPAVKNAQGKWVEIDQDVVCDDNVAVYLAPISAYYNVSFYDETNAIIKDKVEAWNVLSKKTYFWLYQTNFNYYFYPYDSTDAMLETYRLCMQNGMTYLYNQGQYTEYACPYSAFTMLKEYVDS